MDNYINGYEEINKDFTTTYDKVFIDNNYNKFKANDDFMPEACRNCPNYLNAKRSGTYVICNCTLGLPKITC